MRFSYIVWSINFFGYPLGERIHAYFICTTVVSHYIYHVEHGGEGGREVRIINRHIFILMVNSIFSYNVPVKLGLGW